MSTVRTAVFVLVAGFSMMLVFHTRGLAAEQVGGFEIIANLENPDHDSQQTSFRSVVLRFPWVYALADGWSLKSGRLCVFRVPANMPRRKADDDQDGQATRLKPVNVLENVGDGLRMVRWDDLLVCTKNGGLEVYSLNDPHEPKRIGHAPTTGKGKRHVQAVIRDGNRAYVIGDSVIGCYDLSDPTRPRCIGETATKYEGRTGCISEGHLLGGTRKDRSQQEGVAVFDAADPAKLRELAFVPVSRAVWHVFPTPGKRLLASMDGDSLRHSYSPPNRVPSGKAAIVNVAKPTRPSLVKEMKYSGSRAATTFSTGNAFYFVCEAAVFLVRGDDLETAYEFWDCGSTLSGFPYCGDSDSEYVALPNDEGVVLLKYRRI